MKKVAQIISSILVVALITKSLFVPATMVDAIMAIALIGVYSMYEFLNETNLQKEFRQLKEQTDLRMDKLDKDLGDTKNYVSKVSTSIAFKR